MSDQARDKVNAKIAGMFAEYSPAFSQVFLDLCAEQRRKRKAGEVMPARPVSEGRNDWQNRKNNQEWTR